MTLTLWLWFQKEELAACWMGFVAALMAVLMVFVLPALSTSYLLMLEPVRMATGAH